MIRAETFRQAAAQPACLSLAELLALHGRASQAALLLVLAGLCVLPVAGVGTALGFVLLVMAWRWPQRAARRAPAPSAGRGSLFARVAAYRLDETWSRRCLHALAWLHEAAACRLRRRWRLLRHPRSLVWWRLWIAAMALLILLPLPLGNVLPGISLMALSLGWMARDGVALAASAVVGSAALGYGWFSLHVIVQAFGAATALAARLAG